MTMSTSGFSYLRASTSTTPTTDISDAFRRHLDSLSELQRKANQAITEWKTGLMNQIEEYAHEQKSLVDEAYKVRRKHLDYMRHQFVETYNIHRQKNETEEIKRLLENCKNIQMELVNLKTLSVNQELIEVTPIKSSEEIDQEKLNSTENSGNTFQDRSMGRDAINPVRNKYFTLNLCSTSTASVADRTNQPPLAQSVYDRNQSKDVIDDNNSSDECPLCFMIFPSGMTHYKRQIHMDDHYRD